MNNKEIRKEYIEEYVDIEASQSVTKVTEDIRGLLASFKKYLVTKNIPEFKNLIQDFVKEVIVYKTHVEVVFNVGFDLSGENGYKFISSHSRSRIRKHEISYN